MTSNQQEADVVDVLSTDHTEFLELIDRMRASSDTELRADLRDTLISEVVRHSVAEEMHVYPTMEKELPDGEQAVAHDKQEHNQLEQVMKQLEGADPADPAFDSLLMQMEGLLRDHVNDEENEQFPKLRANVERDQLVSLADKVETAKKIAPTRPHPNAPNEQVFHKLVGPGVGLVDRLRDKLAGRSTS